MTQLSLFGHIDAEPPPKPDGDQTRRLRVLITVKAAPNPSEKYGETVCVAGLSTDFRHPGWVRLYPINFRDLDSNDRFRKYDVVSIDARPARQDPRRESWKPIPDSIEREGYLPPWNRRRALLDPLVEDSMCRLNRNARERADAQSLALVRPDDVGALKITRHPGWTVAEQRKIDAYVSQLDLFAGQERTPLQPPRFRGTYHYRCHEPQCAGHRQGLLDWEWVAFQRRLRRHTDEQLCQALEDKFLGELCDSNRDVAFYVGNQAKRAHVFSVLGVYYPPKSRNSRATMSVAV